jgi:hypothetical protein
MMCIACELRARWLAQSRRQGGIAPNDFPAAERPLLAATVEPPSPEKKNDGRALQGANKHRFSCE